MKNTFMTIMSSSPSNSYQYFTTNTIATSVVVVVLHLFISSVLCSNQLQPSLSPRGLLFEDKSRLGSTPPSCHNKCNECHPCMAVQVPSMPSHNHDQPSLAQAKPLSYYDPSYQGSRYSNYKPLGWKCRCGGHFFNP